MFFEMAQGLPYIWASFEGKFVTKNFLKIAQSGHTAANFKVFIFVIEIVVGNHFIGSLCYLSAGKHVKALFSTDGQILSVK